MRELVKDDWFWRKKPEEVAFLVVSKSRTVNWAVDGDAAIAKGASFAAASSPHLVPAPPQPAYARLAKGPKIRQHQVDDKGLLRANRAGRSLCPEWQAGACQKGDRPGVSPRNPGSVHQCSKCLSQEHGARYCTSSASKAPNVPGKGKGKGKDKKQEEMASMLNIIK